MLPFIQPPKKIGLLLCLALLFCMGRAGAQINKVEYFIDADPGFGLATDIPVAIAIDIANQTANINLNNVANGLHNLFIRSKDAAGNWSITNQVPFFKTNAIAAANITRVEYFFDTDPGFGQATAIPTGTGNNISDQAATINLSTISNGFHNLFIRSQDAGGLWSITNQVPFYKTNAVANANITRVEYFLDTDPGFGQATAISTGTGNDLSNQTATIDLSTVSNGFHNLFIRSKDAGGLWSITNQVAFFKVAATDSPNIVRSEYFIDTDPGFGLASPLIINPALQNVADKIVPVNISCLSIGDHRLFIRSQDANGKWSITNTNSFTVAAVAPQVILVTSYNAPNHICNGSSFSLTYDGGSCTYNAGNIFNVEISDATGVFAAVPPVIGTVTTTAKSGTITGTLPFNFASGTYKIRVSSTAPAITGTASDLAITIVKPVTSAITGATVANAGTIYPYSVTNAAGSSYTWAFANGTQNSGGTTNSVTATFPVAGTQTVTVTETNQFGCVGDAVSKNITVYQLGITNATSTVTPCPGTGFTVNFSSTGVYDAGNLFTVQLSDAGGSFANPVNLGSVAANPVGSSVANSITVTLPLNTPDGNGYVVRVVSNTPTVTGSSSAAITVSTSDVFAFTQNITVNGNLDMAQVNPALFPCWRGGKLVLGNFNLTVNGTITNFDAAHFVVTNGTGNLKLVNANSNNTYPVGPMIGNPNFVRIANTGTSDNFSVSVKEGVLRNGFSGAAVNLNNVNRTWNITEEIAGGSNAAVTLLWAAPDELNGFSRNDCRLAHYTTGPDWDLATQSGTAATEAGSQFSQTGTFTSFSPFTVTNTINTLLPLVVQFSGNTYTGYNLLQWHTVSEINTHSFEIERSTDGVSFSGMSSVAAVGSGNNRYLFTDKNVTAGTYHYRLKMKDKNGSFTYSNILKLSQVGGQIISVFPNPATHTITVAGLAAKGNIALLTIEGKVLKLVTVTAQTLTMDVSRYAPGTYLLRYQSGEKTTWQKLIKE